jgi:biopolymer transport protein ExbB
MLNFLQAGGPFMWVLLATSVVALAFIIERGWALRRNRLLPTQLESAIDRCHGLEDLPALQMACHQNPSTLARLVGVAIEHLSAPKSDNAAAVQTRARNEVQSLERGLVVLEVVVGISPLLGLIGTIHGLIILFGDLGQQGITDNSAFARGISIALHTTLAGLLIAVPTLIAWSYYTKKVESVAVEMETVLDDFIRRLYRRSGDPAAGNSDLTAQGGGCDALF